MKVPSWLRWRSNSELEEEIQAHLEMEIESNVDRGLSREEARVAARRTLGNLAAIKERAREGDPLFHFDVLVRDVRYALRGLGRSPTFAFAVLFTLALGISANTAIFALVKAVFLEPFSYDASTLVQIVENVPPGDSTEAIGMGANVPRAGRRERISLNPLEAEQLRARSETLSTLAIYSPESMVLVDVDESRVFPAAHVSPEIFTMLKATPVVGRLLVPSDDRPNAERVVVISYRAWQEYFGGDPDVLGKEVRLHGPTPDVRSYTVVGVAPSYFQFPLETTAFWTAFSTTLGMERRGTVLAQLEDGQTLESGTLEMRQLVPAIRAFPSVDPDDASEGRFEIVSARDEATRSSRWPLVLLIVAAGIVLLVACANVAALFLARLNARTHEMAIRMALGAQRGRLFREIMTESLLFAFSGGIFGLLLAAAATNTLIRLWPGNVYIPGGGALPRVGDIEIDGSVAAFTVVLSCVTAILFGTAPASIACRSESTRASGGVRISKSRQLRVLVVAEVALATVLLSSAGLLINSFWRLTRVNPGFDSAGVLTFRLIRSPEAPDSLDEDLVSQIESLPGVIRAGYSMWEPIEPGRWPGPLLRVPGVQDATLQAADPRFLAVSDGYLQTIGVELVAGRWFESQDGSSAPPVMLVNTELARYFPGGDPVGAVVRLGDSGSTAVQVVGVVGEIRQLGLREQSAPQYFLDYRQSQIAPVSFIVDGFFAVRTEDDPTTILPGLRAMANRLAPGTTIGDINTMEELVRNSLAVPRFYAWLPGTFAGVAVVLAAVGLYGLLAWTVTQRTPEIAIRMALGAQPGKLRTWVIQQAVTLSISGLTLGLLGALTATRYLKTMLFGLTPLDPTTFAVVIVFFVLTTAVAAYLPARRATKVDPLITLRQD